MEIDAEAFDKLLNIMDLKIRQRAGQPTKEGREEVNSDLEWAVADFRDDIWMNKYGAGDDNGK